MLSSILHRFTGIGLYAAAILFAVWLMAAAAGAEIYAPVQQALVSPIGGFILYLIVAALAYHLANGIRHLVFDVGVGFALPDANASGWFVILFAVAAPIGLWALVTFGA
jgi:succinate dehydrogenase / fumarate reductase cytochrome b subunit